MNYFTPELLGRFGSQNDEVALAAQEELENRVEKYTAHLKAIVDKLPERFRIMLQQFYLHDARLLSPGFPMPFLMPWRFHWLDWQEMCHFQGLRDQLPSLLFAFQLESPPKEVLVLNYRSVTIEALSQHRPFQDKPLPFLEWQHDEVDVVMENGIRYALHSILFSSGLELRVRFSDFDYATMKPLPNQPVTNGHAPR